MDEREQQSCSSFAINSSVAVNGTAANILAEEEENDIIAVSEEKQRQQQRHQQQNMSSSLALRRTLAGMVPACRRLVAALADGLESRAIRNDTEAILAATELQEQATIVEEVRALVSRIDASQLCLPPVNPRTMTCTTFCRPVETIPNLLEMSIFGFAKTGDYLPLHDHPRMFGFMRPLYGRVRVYTYSWLDPAEEQRLLDTELRAVLDRWKPLPHWNIRPARFEGEHVLSARPGDPLTVGVLKPEYGNLHMVVGMDDGAAFFDLLMPGYNKHRECTYYYQLGAKEPNSVMEKIIVAQLNHPTEVGGIVWLRDDYQDSYFTMQPL